MNTWITMTALAVIIGSFVFAAKRRRRKGKLIYLQCNISNSVASLAAGDVVATLQANTVIDRVFAVWAKGVWSLQANTAGDGPLMVGLAHGDYTAAEIEECLEAGGSWNQSDKIAMEQAKRFVRRTGVFDGLLTSEKLMDGAPVYQKLGFMIEDGETIQSWARNQDADTRQAAGSVNWNGIIAVRPT